MNLKALALPGLAAIAVAAAPILLPGVALAKSPEVYTAPLSKLAVGGYDPVAYFTDGKPVKGDPRYRLMWKGAEVRFASAEHLARFRANPDAYAPRYGGYCAWAVSDGHLAKGDPLVWRLVGGRLYLNYDAGVQRRWAKDVPGNIAKANRNWPGVLR